MAVFVVTEGGVPVIFKEFSTVFALDEAKKELVPSLITAIISFVRETLGVETHIIKIENFYLHVVRSEGLIVCLVSDREERRAYDIGRQIAKRIKELEIGDIVALTSEEEEVIAREIVDIVRHNPPRVEDLFDIYMASRGLIGEEKCSGRLPVDTRLGAVSVVEEDFEDLDEAADKLLGFKIVNGSKLLKLVGAGDSDYAYALYIFNKLLRFEYGLDLDEPLEGLYKLVFSIKDDLLREILYYRIRSLEDVAGMAKFTEILMRNREKLQSYIRVGDLRSKIFVLSLLLHWAPLFHVVGDTVMGSEWLSREALLLLQSFKFRYLPVSSLDELVDLFGEIGGSSSVEMEPLSAIYVASKLLLATKSIILLPEIDLDTFLLIFKRNLKRTIEILENLDKLSLPISVLIHFLSIMDDWMELILLFDIHKELGLDLDKLYGFTGRLIRNIEGYIKAKKINRAFAYLMLIKLFKLLTVIDFEKGRCNLDIVFGLEGILSEGSFNLFMGEWRDYLRYYMKALTIISYFTTKIEGRAIKRIIMERVSKEMDSISEILGLNHPEVIFNLISVIKSLWLSEDPALQGLAKAKVKIYDKKLNIALTDMFEKLTIKYM